MIDTYFDKTEPICIPPGNLKIKIYLKSTQTRSRSHFFCYEKTFDFQSKKIYHFKALRI